MWRRYRRFLRPDVAGDIEDELRFHFAERIEELTARGMSLREARQQAEAEFGDVSAVRHDLRQIDQRLLNRHSRLERLMVLLQEVSQAVRRLVRSPGFSVPAVIALMLGLAATATVFSLLDAVVLRPLPFPNGDRLVSLSSPMPMLKDVWGLARHQMFYYKANAHTLEDLALYRSYQQGTVTHGRDGQPAERVHLANVSANIFHVLGIQPHVGRLLTPEDNLVRNPTVLVLGYEYWQRRFGSDPAIVGQSIELNGFPMQVVGIAAKGASLPDQRVDVWIPDYVDPAMPAMNNHVRAGVALLRPGFTAADLERELVPLVRRMEEVFPSAYPHNWIRENGFSTAVISLRDEVVGATVTRALWTLLGAVALVLLIAAANVINLFMVRADTRRREVAVRTALGASRLQLLMHHLSEGLVVAVVAGLGAIALSWGALRLIVALAPSGLPRLTELHFGMLGAVLIVGTALGIGLLLGAVTLGYARRDLSALRDGGRGLTSSRPRTALRGALVASQVALALVLLTGAALMFRSFQKLSAVNMGFDAEGVSTMSLALPEARYDREERTTAFYQELQQRVLAVPGVKAVGFSSRIPLIGHEGCSGVLTDQPSSTGRSETCVTNLQNAPGYFETMRTPVRGRIPTWADVQQRSGAVVVTQALANVLWPGEDPLGRHIRCCASGPAWYTVVGVSADVHDAGLDEPPMQGVYFPMESIPGAPIEATPTYMYLTIRAPTLSAAELVSAVQRILSDIDPSVPVANVASMTHVVDQSMAKRTFTLLLLAVAATMALILSAVGLYGVISYVVGQRGHEIGIRMALGASRRDVAQLVVRQSLTYVMAGVAIGLAGALGATRVLRSLLFGVSPTDPLVLSLVTVVLITLGVLAALGPTRRATRVDPVDTLRSA